MIAFALALALATPQPLAKVEGKRRVLVMDLKAQGVAATTVQTIGDVVASAFARDPALLVTSGADLRALVDVEASKRSLDCKEAESCLAEIAGALGADVVVSGSVGKLGDVLVVNLSMFEAATQTSVAKAKVEDADVARLSPKIDAAVAGMLGARAPSLLVPGLVIAGVGVAAVIAGGALGVLSYPVIVDPKTLGAQKDQAAQLYDVGLVVDGVGLLAVLGGVVVAVLE